MLPTLIQILCLLLLGLAGQVNRRFCEPLWKKIYRCTGLNWLSVFRLLARKTLFEDFVSMNWLAEKFLTFKLVMRCY